MSNEDEQEKCPECRSTQISGIVPGFWIDLSEGVPNSVEIGENARSCTELGEERMCRACDHEWEI